MFARRQDLKLQRDAKDLGKLKRSCDLSRAVGMFGQRGGSPSGRLTTIATRSKNFFRDCSDCGMLEGVSLVVVGTLQQTALLDGCASAARLRPSHLGRAVEAAKLRKIYSNREGGKRLRLPLLHSGFFRRKTSFSSRDR